MTRGRRKDGRRITVIIPTVLGTGNPISNHTIRPNMGGRIYLLAPPALLFLLSYLLSIMILYDLPVTFTSPFPPRVYIVTFLQLVVAGT